MKSPSRSPFRGLPGQPAWLRRFVSGLLLGALVLSLLAAPGLARVEARTDNQVALSMSVIINEVAWMGTRANPDHEWIELHNPTSNDIVITGWTLKSGDNNPNISLSGTISSGGYFLLERYEAAVDNITADLVYPSSQKLVNAGEALSLYDNSPTPVLIDTANGDGGSWPAGDNTTKCSMERKTGDQDTDAAWITSNLMSGSVCGTPKRINSAFVTPTATPEWQQRLFISEVAWGGTRADDTLAQWIELYNPGGDLNLEEKKCFLRILNKADIELKGIIPAGFYYLIERNQADTNVETYIHPASGTPTPIETPVSSTVFSVPGMVVAFPLLDIDGDRLELYCGGAAIGVGSLADSANRDGGPWPAGNRFFSYDSMERIGPPFGVDSDSAWLNFFGPTSAMDRLGNPIKGSPGQASSSGATSTPTQTPTATATSTPTLSPTVTTTPSGLRSVLINEIAWMGTAANSSDEWIELYNPGSTPISITGWTLTVAGSTFSVTLAGVIPAGGYFLLERTDDLTISDIAADQIYSGTLTDAGMALTLKTASGQTIDTANYNGGAWPAGDKDSKCSMERSAANLADSDKAWITNTGALKNGKDADGNPICGTPGNVNWAYYVTPTPVPAKSAIPTRTRTPTPVPPLRYSQVVINEFLPHPRSDWNQDGKVDFGDEFIELINVGNIAVDLQGWRLDDQEGDSSAFSIGPLSLGPGARQVFFASETGLMLSNRSDSVRVFKPNGAISDAFTYTSIPTPDQSWCRYPDGGQIWVFGCQPTLAETNRLAEIVFRGEINQPAICKSPGLPAPVYLSECLPSGLEAWSRRLWGGLLPTYRLFFERGGQEYWIE